MDLSDFASALSSNRTEELGFDVWDRFVIPPKLNIGEWGDTRKPRVIVGGRGCGKTMLLRYLSHESAFSPNRPTLDHSTLEHIGIYWRADTQFASLLEGRDQSDDIWATDEVPLKAAGGSYYRVGGLGHTDMIASGTNPTKLHYYLMPDGTKAYVESTGTSQAQGSPGVIVHDYISVDVEDGVRLPASRGFEHINYGVWAGLEDAAGDGTQELAGLGIGFVATVPGGDGITEEGDMPNNGSATYDGNYVATVRAADEDGDGAISFKHDDAVMTASFSEGEVRVILHDLATLEGNIDGNTFSGTTAAIHDTNGDTESVDNASGLAGDGEFTDEFRGAFYGEKAKEAGGVFDFTSEDYGGWRIPRRLRRRQIGLLIRPADNAGARSGNGSGAFFVLRD